MRGRMLAIAIVLQLMGSQVLPSALASPQQSKQEKEIEKIKVKVAKFGVGKKVKVRLRADNAEIKGVIAKVDATGFTVSGKELAYSEVKKVDKQGITKAAWIAIGAVATFGVYAALCGGGCGG